MAPDGLSNYAGYFILLLCHTNEAPEAVTCKESAKLSPSVKVCVAVFVSTTPLDIFEETKRRISNYDVFHGQVFLFFKHERSVMTREK